MAEYKVSYWPGFSGRAEPILMLLHDAGKKYELVGDVQAVLGANPKLFACPILTHNNCSIAQTSCILFHLGKTLGYMPADETQALQLSLNLADIWAESYTARKGADGGATFLTNRLGKWLKVLEATIEGKYFYGDKLTFADFQALNILNILEFMYGNGAKTLIQQNPKVDAWLKTVRALPTVQEYYKSAPPVLYNSIKSN